MEVHYYKIKCKLNLSTKNACCTRNVYYILREMEYFPFIYLFRRLVYKKDTNKYYFMGLFRLQ